MGGGWAYRPVPPRTGGPADLVDSCIAHPLGPPPPRTLIPVSEHVWKGSYAVTGNWPCFLCLYLTAE